MPMGALGMEMAGHSQRYQVFALGVGTQRSVYATHG